MGNNKNLWIGVVVVLVIALGLILWSMNKSSDPLAGENGENVAQEQSPEPVEDTSEGSVNVGVSASSISYANALLKYKDARIQLDKICQATPNNVTFKNNTSIMIDNRAPVARTVKVGSTFSIKAWGFKIVKLQSATLPVTWLMDCDKSQNVATILIQK